MRPLARRVGDRRLRPVGSRLVRTLGACAFTLAAAAPASAQDAPSPPRPDFVAPRPMPVGVPAGGPSPTGAFLRSLAVPGWGHAAIGSYTRAGFYVAAQGGTTFALVRTRIRLNEARERATMRERALRSALGARGVTDPAEIDAALDADPRLRDARGLVGAREGQQEDWIALAIFLTLLGGADAFVSAHLARFPDPIEVGVAPGAEGLEVRVRVPVP